MKKSKGRKRKHNTWQTPQKKITPLCCFFFSFFLCNMERLKQTRATFTLDWSLAVFSACRTKRQNRAKLSEPRGVQLNPAPAKKREKARPHSHKQSLCPFTGSRLKWWTCRGAVHVSAHVILAAERRHNERVSEPLNSRRQTAFQPRVQPTLLSD